MHKLRRQPQCVFPLLCPEDGVRPPPLAPRTAASSTLPPPLPPPSAKGKAPTSAPPPVVGLVPSQREPPSMSAGDASTAVTEAPFHTVSRKQKGKSYAQRAHARAEKANSAIPGASNYDPSAMAGPSTARITSMVPARPAYTGSKAIKPTEANNEEASTTPPTPPNWKISSSSTHNGKARRLTKTTSLSPPWKHGTRSNTDSATIATITKDKNPSAAKKSIEGFTEDWGKINPFYYVLSLIPRNQSFWRPGETIPTEALP
ncbi:hypothetical protein EDB84DRAFT_1441964 [Lactarius hengduanensis]|nr:hypothetical protein EDB84DRAFT_1441964 [Lactarius hengduanensis]